MADERHPRSMSLPPIAPRSWEEHAIAQTHINSRLIDDLDDLVKETRDQSVVLGTIQTTLTRIEAERKAEHDHKKWWDGVSRAVLIALVVGLAGWLAKIAMVTQTARLPP